LTQVDAAYVFVSEPRSGGRASTPARERGGSVIVKFRAPGGAKEILGIFRASGAR